MHESSEEFEIHCKVSCPLASEKNPHRLIMGKMCCHFFSAVFDGILFILAGNDQSTNGPVNAHLISSGPSISTKHTKPI